jgi:hypothetical protein
VNLLGVFKDPEIIEYIKRGFAWVWIEHVILRFDDIGFVATWFIVNKYVILSCETVAFYESLFAFRVSFHIKLCLHIFGIHLGLKVWKMRPCDKR